MSKWFFIIQIIFLIAPINAMNEKSIGDLSKASKQFKEGLVSLCHGHEELIMAVSGLRSSQCIDPDQDQLAKYIQLSDEIKKLELKIQEHDQEGKRCIADIINRLEALEQKDNLQSEPTDNKKQVNVVLNKYDELEEKLKNINIKFAEIKTSLTKNGKAIRKLKKQASEPSMDRLRKRHSAAVSPRDFNLSNSVSQ